MLSWLLRFLVQLSCCVQEAGSLWSSTSLALEIRELSWTDCRQEMWTIILLLIWRRERIQVVDWVWKRLTRNRGGSTLSRLTQETLSGKGDLRDTSSPMNYWAKSRPWTSDENWSVSCLFDFSPRTDLQKLWCKECGMCIKLLSLWRWATQLQKTNEPCYESRFVILHGTNGESSLWMNKKKSIKLCAQNTLNKGMSNVPRNWEAK